MKIKDDVKEALDKKQRIVFIDEAVYTAKTYQSREWSSKRNHVARIEGYGNHEWFYQVVAASLEKGIEVNHIYNKLKRKYSNKIARR